MSTVKSLAFDLVKVTFARGLVNHRSDVQRFGDKKILIWEYSVEPLKSGPQRLRVLAVVGKPDSDDSEDQFVYNEEVKVDVNIPQ